MGMPVNEESLSRRRFFQVVIAGCNAAIALLLAVPGLGYLLTPVFRKGNSAWIKLGSTEDFVGADPRKAIFRYVSQAGYVQREKSGFVWVLPAEEKQPAVALSAVCTHTGCNVAWKTAEGQFVCPCHGGRYDREGKVVSGPPPRPLQRLPVKSEGGQLFVQIGGAGH